jgi:hypothetical protein
MPVLGVRPIIAQLREELHRCTKSGLYVVGQDTFIRMMAEAAGAAKEEHSGGDRGCENHRVVSGSAGHPAGWKACLSCGFTKQVGQVRIKWNRGLLKLPGAGNVDATSGCGRLGMFQDREEGSLAKCVIGVTQIE